MRGSCKTNEGKDLWRGPNDQQVNTLDGLQWYTIRWNNVVNTVSHLAIHSRHNLVVGVQDVALVSVIWEDSGTVVTKWRLDELVVSFFGGQLDRSGVDSQWHL
jgi:hypothetical protein